MLAVTLLGVGMKHLGLFVLLLLTVPPIGAEPRPVPPGGEVAPNSGPIRSTPAILRPTRHFDPALLAPAASRRRLDVRFPAPAADRRDFRWAGTAIGALGLGIAGAIQGAAYCGNSENGPRDCTGTTVGFGLAGAAIGGIVGHVVGSLLRR